MAATNDTIDGLLAEFRGYSAGMPASYHVTMSWADFRKMLDRFDAAHRREVATTKESLAVGNSGDCAKMREVMNRVHDYLGELIRDNLVEDTPRASDLADDVYDAIHGSHSTAEKSSVAGDCAKLREALEHLDKLTREFVAGNYYVSDFPKMLRDVIQPALAAPARNCDKYANHNDAMKAFEAFVREQGKLGFINPYTEAFKWLFAPATEKEGGAKC